MEFYSTFAKKSNAVTVDYPAGDLSFTLLPKGHPDVMKAASNFIPLDVIDKITRLSSAGVSETEMVSEMAKHFKTMSEFNHTQLMFVAAHIEGWANLKENGELVAFSHDKAVEYVVNAEPFAEWVIKETARLGEIYEAEQEKLEDVKKKSESE